MYLSYDELYVILMIGGFGLAVIIAVPIGMALASLIQWVVDKFS